MFKGIDVSKWQGSINWNEVKKTGIDFAIIREGWGKKSSTQTDKKFKENYETNDQFKNWILKTLPEVEDCKNLEQCDGGIVLFKFVNYHILDISECPWLDIYAVIFLGKLPVYSVELFLRHLGPAVGFDDDVIVVTAEFFNRKYNYSHFRLRYALIHGIVSCNIAQDAAQIVDSCIIEVSVP